MTGKLELYLNSKGDRITSCQEPTPRTRPELQTKTENQWHWRMNPGCCSRTKSWQPNRSMTHAGTKPGRRRLRGLVREKEIDPWRRLAGEDGAGEKEPRRGDVPSGEVGTAGP
jgi:hypothetical protein